MILDGLLQFSSAQLITASADSTNVIDLGISGLPASASGGGARDIGIGDDPAMKVLVIVTAVFATLTSLQVLFRGAPDSGTGTEGSYTTMVSGPVVLLAQLVVGARLLDIDVPRQVPNQALPRFLKLNYTVGGSSATTGSVSSYLVLDRHDLPEQANAVLGGYVPGITIAN